jgi:spermidine/putrescine transport system substrate-binding protein
MIVVTLSFAFGVYWGMHLRAKQRAQAGANGLQTKTLRVLSYRGLIDRGLVSAFERRTGITIVLEEVATPEALWERLETSKPGAEIDAVSLLSYQVPLATQLQRIQTVDRGLLKNFGHVSPDFVDLPGDRSHGGVVPILWGMMGVVYDAKKVDEPQSWSQMIANAKLKGKIALPSSAIELQRLATATTRTNNDPKTKAQFNFQKVVPALLGNFVLVPDFLSPISLLGSSEPPTAALISHGETVFLDSTGPAKWQFFIPQERATFWILSFAQARESENTIETHAFIDYLLEQDSALKLVRSFRQASANRSLEISSLDERLKPSYLRKVSLGEILFWQDFSRAREIRKLLPPVTAAAAEQKP